MRKIAAIFLMFILLFNTGGYRIAIHLLTNKTSQELEARIDNREYDESQLVEVKIEMNLPYQDRYTDFERHYGELELNGRSYTYVERKIEGNVVIFKCIANDSREQLEAIRDNMTKANSNSDMQQAPGQQQPSFAKNLLSEYDQPITIEPLIIGKFVNTLLRAANTLDLPQRPANTPLQPPELIAVLS
ncbi:MAG TPA: hypothetical protein VFZ42_17760 [Chitinophagaceae bacterium]